MLEMCYIHAGTETKLGYAICQKLYDCITVQLHYTAIHYIDGSKLGVKLCPPIYKMDVNKINTCAEKKYKGTYHKI